MTLRGRLTLFGLALLPLVAVWQGLGGDEAGARPAPPLEPQAVAPPPRRAPAEILTLLPPPARGAGESVPDAPAWVEAVTVRGAGGAPESLRVEYTLDPELMRRVATILRRGRVALGHVIVLEPASGRVLAYASTDPQRFPPTRAYAAASLIKVVTAAAALERDPAWGQRSCRYRGNPYRLTRARLDPPRRGNVTSLRRALALSNNQCFAQQAVHGLGAETLFGEIDRFGLREVPAPGHEAGRVDPVEDPLDLGRLGSGLDGCRITPLAAARLAATLATGELVQPRWIARVTDAHGRRLALPDPAPPRPVLAPRLRDALRSMLVDTTEKGTARRAFRGRRGRPLLAPIRVAGKTGSLSGRNPDGRYEWFIGVAPAERPRVAIATLVVHGDLWWRNASQVAAEVLKAALCPEGRCRAS